MEDALNNPPPSSSSAGHAILCVDDDLMVLSGFQRNLRKQFEITGAIGGEKALKVLRERGPFAVIISDLQMPGMNGLEFLTKARDISPDSVQIILSGKADVNTAITAVNEGGIFRFLTKPCSPEVLAANVESALAHYNNLQAKRELLHSNLQQSVRETLKSLEAQDELERQRVLAVEVQTSSAVPAPQSAAVDAVTGLPTAAEGEIAIRTMVESGEPSILVSFYVRRMRFNQLRFGNEVCQKVLLIASQHLASGLTAMNATLFRWHGAGFVALIPTDKPVSTVRAELQVTLSSLQNQYFEGSFRTVYLPINLAMELFPLAGSTTAAILQGIEQFASKESDE